MADWSDIEDALRVWVKAATGLADAAVIWAEQTGARPAGTFITLRLGDIVPVGLVDEIAQSYSGAAPLGEEITLTAVGTREFRVSLQCFTAAVVGDTWARTLLAQCQTALSLPTRRDALRLAGCTVFDLGQVQNVTALNDTRFEGRAVLDVGLYCLEKATEKTGYIATVEVEDFTGPPASGTRDNIDL